MESETDREKELYKLSEPQKLILFSEIIYKGSSINTLCATYELGECHDLKIMRQAVKEVASENPGLHIRIHMKEGEPHQYLSDEREPDIIFMDFRGENDSSAEEVWIESLAGGVLPLEDSQLYQFCLYYSFDTSLKMVIQTHHIITDAWSHQSLALQIKEKYHALERGETPEFRLRYSYLDYIKTEEDFISSKRAEKSREYWQNKFAGIERFPELQFKKNPDDSSAEKYIINFDENMQKRVVAICEGHGISFPSFFLACLLISFMKKTGEKKHLIGTLSYNRLGSKEKEAIGMFVNTLPAYFDLEGAESFKDIVMVIDREMSGLLRHQRYPYSHVVNDPELKALNIAESIGLMYTYENVILPFHYISHHNHNCNYPLLFRPVRMGEEGEFFIVIEYQKESCSLEEVKKISKLYTEVIEGLDEKLEGSVFQKKDEKELTERVYCPLSEPQKLILLSEVIYNKSSINTLCATYELGEYNDIELMRRTIKQVVSENPGLHIRIHFKEGEPFQYLQEEHGPEIIFMDFREESDSLAEKVWIESLASEIITLEDSPLYQFALYYSWDSSLNMLIQTHHIITDAWSHQSLALQIEERYRALAEKTETESKIRYSYLDFVKTEEDFLTSKRAEKSREYWRGKLGGMHKLPPSLAPKKTSHAEAESVILNFPDDIQKKIVNICEENKISFPTFFLACLMICYCKSRAQKEFLIGSLSYNRLGGKEKEAIGMFVNTLPTFFDFEGAESFKDFACVIDKEMSGLLRHQRYPYSRIVNDPELKALNIAENIGLMYTYENVILPFNYISHHNKNCNYPLLIRPTRMGEEGDFFIVIEYQKESFTRDQIQDLSKMYAEVISSLDRDVSSPVLKEDGFAYPFVQKPYNLEQTLHGIFEESVIKWKDRVAVSFGDLELTYEELNNRANYLAHKLLDQGAGKERPVALIMDRSLDMMVAILAVLKTGSCYLPLSPDQPINRIQKIITVSGTTIVLTNSDKSKELGKSVYIIDFREFKYPDYGVGNPDEGILPDNLAYIIYTSGSTGEPKGVMLEHRAVVNRLYWKEDYYPHDENDTLIQKTPYTFDVSVWEIFLWFFNGSSVHFLVPGGEKDPETLIEVIEKKNITTIHFVPSMLTLFLEYLEHRGESQKVSCLNRVICSGEALKLPQVKHFYKLLHEPWGVTLHNFYGPTEAAIDVTYYDCTGSETEIIPIGKPVVNTELYVVNDKGEVLEPEEPGELVIAGVCLARGYFHKPELTNEKFVFNTHLNKRVYHTGDLAEYLPDGNIKYLGRIDNQVKIRGNRIELGEIENCMESFEGIIESAVLPHVSEAGHTTLKGFYCAGDEISLSDLREHIGRELPSYMVPSAFVKVDEFPLSPSGKLDRKALLLQYSSEDVKDPVPEAMSVSEKVIHDIWSLILNIERIDCDKNFFDLGGDSLMLIKVHYRLKDRYDIKLQDLFEYPTIGSLALHLEEIHSDLKPVSSIEYHDVHAVWCEVLNKEKISGDKKFFDLGGDSLMMIKVHYSLKEKYDIKLQDLFEHPTIGALAEFLQSKAPQEKVQEGFEYNAISSQRKEAQKVQMYFKGLKQSHELRAHIYRNLFITGATGFLGAYLVREYLEKSAAHLYLMVRGSTTSEAEGRLLKKLDFYFGDGYFEEFQDRMTVVKGDLSQKHLGIDETQYKRLSSLVDGVIHCAANVRHYGNREEINKINVTGTQEVVNFCRTGGKKRIFYISTMSVGLNMVSEGWSYHFVEEDVPLSNEKGNVYIDSKIIAEAIVREALPELNGQILRVGNVVNDSETGAFQENVADNAFMTQLSEYKKRGAAPDIDIPFIDLSFVNETARAVCLLSSSSAEGTFHLFNPSTITLRDICESFHIKMIPFKEYLATLSYQDSLLTHGYYLNNVKLLGFIPYCDHTLSVLEQLGFSWSTSFKLTEEYFAAG